MKDQMALGAFQFSALSTSTLSRRVLSQLCFGDFGWLCHPSLDPWADINKSASAPASNEDHKCDGIRDHDQHIIMDLCLP